MSASADRRPARRRVPAIAVAGVAALAVLADSALATFPGERGRIAFQRVTDPSAEGSEQIFTVGPRGGPARRLTSLSGGAFAPDYSPDGQRIAFERRGITPEALYVMRANGADQVALSTGGCTGLCLGEGDAAWSPDGSRLLFARAFGPIVRDNASQLDLVVANADGSGAQLLRAFRPLEGEGREPHGAQWSPDGRRIAVTILNITAKPELGSAIYVLNADGTGLRRITPFRLNAGNPDWSPNGRRIVFNSSFEGQAAVEIYTVRPDGRRLHRVRRDPRGKSYSFEPVWSPDGRRIAMVHGSGRAVPHIWTMRRNGTGLRQVTRGRLPDFSPDWGSR
jgi:TolB protein